MSKFPSPLAEKLYKESLNGWDDGNFGDSNTFGWFALFKAERAILSEDSSGFVYLTVFASDERLMERWNNLETRWVQFYKAQDEEAPF